MLLTTSSGLDWPFSQPTKLREKKLAASAVRDVTQAWNGYRAGQDGR
jgi:hypothetical protein